MAMLEISRLQIDDLKDLALLYQQLIANDISLEKMREAYARNSENPNHIVFVAKLNGDLIGTALAVVCQMYFGQCRSFMVVEDVVVDVKYRGKGIGTALMHEIENHARSCNCAYIMLITDTDRVDSQQFYRSLGYKSSEYCAFKKHL